MSLAEALPEWVAARAQDEADRRGVTLDELVIEAIGVYLTLGRPQGRMSKPRVATPRPRSGLSIIGIGASGGRRHDVGDIDDELAAEGFGRD